MYPIKKCGYLWHNYMIKLAKRKIEVHLKLTNPGVYRFFVSITSMSLIININISAEPISINRTDGTLLKVTVLLRNRKVFLLTVSFKSSILQKNRPMPYKYKKNSYFEIQTM